MTKYAAETKVTVEASRAEIERILSRYGAHEFGYFQDAERATIMFAVQGRRVKFVLPMPKRDDPAFTVYKRSEYGVTQTRTAESARNLWEQACRQRWRALCLAVKAKLEAVESKIATFEEEFLAYIVLPNNETVGEFLRPQLDEVYQNHAMPLMLPGIGGTGRGN